MFLLFNIYFLIRVTAGISGVFALKLGYVINCKTFPLSDRISLDSAIKERWEVNALHSSCISLVIKIIIALGGKHEQTFVSVDGAMNIADDVRSAWIWSLCPSSSFHDCILSKPRCTVISFHEY